MSSRFRSTSYNWHLSCPSMILKVFHIRSDDLIIDIPKLFGLGWVKTADDG